MRLQSTWVGRLLLLSSRIPRLLDWVHRLTPRP